MEYTLCLVSAEDQEEAAAIDPNNLAFDVAVCALEDDPLGAEPTNFFSNGPFSAPQKAALLVTYAGIPSFRTEDWDDEETSVDLVLAGLDLQFVQVP